MLFRVNIKPVTVTYNTRVHGENNIIPCSKRAEYKIGET